MPRTKRQPAAAPSLFELAPAGWSVWYRPGPGDTWCMVGTAETHAAAVATIGAGGRRGGDWLLTNREERPAAAG